MTNRFDINNNNDMEFDPEMEFDPADYEEPSDCYEEPVFTDPIQPYMNFHVVISNKYDTISFDLGLPGDDENYIAAYIEKFCSPIKDVMSKIGELSIARAQTYKDKSDTQPEPQPQVNYRNTGRQYTPTSNNYNTAPFEPATEKQKNLLLRNGYNFQDISKLSKSEAAKLIKNILNN